MADRIKREALTFDDILLVPGHSEVLPTNVNLQSRLTKDICLNIPLVSAAMDTVTGSRTAITMARQGGLGFIHKGYSIEKQAEKVTKVKRSQSGQITKPYYLGPGSRLSSVRKLMEGKNISGVPIVERGKLVGLLTKRDIQLLPSDLNPKVREIMKKRKNLIVAPPETSLVKARDILHKHRIEKLPLVDENDKLFGLITVKDILKEVLYPLAVTDSKGRLLVGAAVGAGSDLSERAEALVEAGADVLCLDSSHGHSAGVLKACKKIKELFPEIPLIGGNVATADGAKALIDSGVDAVKVGIGPGSICTTRIVTGGGMPQITAIMEAFKVACDHDIPVIADGGIKYSGEVVKALAAGADTVMIGSMFAGTEESPGEVVLIEGRSYKVYRGMGSIDAMKESGSGERYFQEGAKKLVAEGIVGRVPYRGPLSEAIFQIIGGVRQGMGLAGAKEIHDLWKTEIIKITGAGSRESHPHDVTIIKEAPNYPGQERR